MVNVPASQLRRFNTLGKLVTMSFVSHIHGVIFIFKNSWTSKAKFGKAQLPYVFWGWISPRPTLLSLLILLPTDIRTPSQITKYILKKFFFYSVQECDSCTPVSYSHYGVADLCVNFNFQSAYLAVKSISILVRPQCLKHVWMTVIQYNRQYNRTWLPHNV